MCEINESCSIRNWGCEICRSSVQIMQTLTRQEAKEKKKLCLCIFLQNVHHPVSVSSASGSLSPSVLMFICLCLCMYLFVCLPVLLYFAGCLYFFAYYCLSLLFCRRPYLYTHVYLLLSAHVLVYLPSCSSLFSGSSVFFCIFLSVPVPIFVYHLLSDRIVCLFVCIFVYLPPSVRILNFISLRLYKCLSVSASLHIHSPGWLCLLLLSDRACSLSSLLDAKGCIVNRSLAKSPYFSELC